MDKQRANEYLIPEDPLILKNLKVLQDVSSPERALLPCQEDNIAHTFNNCLVAMAFIIKDERERAERILDFFANAMDEENTDPYLQNFYCNGEARGFYQNVLLRDENGVRAYHTAGFTDRWMGDMAWMIIAYLFYEKNYGFDKKPSYLKIKRALLDLLKSFYTDDPNGNGGYIRHGWRWGSVEIRSAVECLMNQSLSLSDMVARYRVFSEHEDIELDALLSEARNDDHLHEPIIGGHHEGNIDCYSVLRHLGESRMISNIKTWLGREIGRMEAAQWRMPLDLVSWRVLAFGKDVPDWYRKLYVIYNDERFRKTVVFNGKEVTGFFHGAEPDIKNIWIDGLGHMACAFYEAGDRDKGNYYANQMDKLIVKTSLGGRETHAIPYTTNHTGGYNWVDTEKGFISASAWYIFAKNQFNPLDIR